MADFLEQLRAATALESPRKRYLIGVSGGCDSLALLHGLHTLGYGKLIVCHLNHGLRGKESQADAALVSRTAKKLGYRVAFLCADTRKTAQSAGQSLELAAREMRYAFFAKCVRKWRCSRIFLAHHADDQVETILHNFLRGTGAAGLGGMRPVNQRASLTILRPLLGVTRMEIAEFARRQKFSYREDASNLDPQHTRNRLRHGLLPAMEKAVGSSFKTAILRAGEILREENDWMESLVPATPEKLSCRELAAMAPALRRRAVLRWLKLLGVPEAGFAETSRVLSLLNDGDGPAKISLPGGFQGRRTGGKIFLERPAS